jgi:glycosyltransferase involved in cell wall biosynthesis
MVKISVCIPTYNGERYIKEQIESILAQLSVDDEVIVSDDGSTDETIDILKSFRDSRIKVFSNSEIINPYHGSYRKIYSVYKNVENALKKASGDYIFLADQDDIWKKNKVCVMSKNLCFSDLVLHDSTVIDENENIILDSYYTWSKPSTNLIKMVLNPAYQGCSMAFSKKIKQQSLPFPNNPISHDHWIAWNARISGKVTIIQDKLLNYRRHGNNVSFATKRSANSIAFKISYRMRIIYSVINILKNKYWKF